MKKQDLKEFVERFETPMKLKSELLEQTKDIISRYSIPERYLEGFKGDDLLLRKMELVQKRRQSPKERLSPLKTDVKRREQFKSGKKMRVKSKCVDKIHKLGILSSEFEGLSKETGVPLSIIEKVYNKGVGAFYSSGSRPGMTAQQWGFARVACFLAKKETVVFGPDKKLYEQALKNAKAKKYFDSITSWR